MLNKKGNKGKHHEVLFKYVMLKEGLSVLTPEFEEYFDLVVLNESGYFHKVQVKSTEKSRADSDNENIFRLKTTYSNGNIPLDRSVIDVVALYIKPVDWWYFVPVQALKGRKTISINVSKDSCEFRQYRFNYNIFK